MKTYILQSLKNLWQGKRPAPPTVSQVGIQARAIRHLIATGWIDARTVLNMGTNDATKMFSRLRDAGLLFHHADPAGHVWLDNHSGHGKYKRHRWTGKVPANWQTSERRKRLRGGK